MRIILLLLTTLTINANLCADISRISQEWSESKQNKAERVVNLICQRTAKALESQYRVRCIGEGAGMCGGPIRNISLRFLVTGPLLRNEVRRLLFRMSDEMILQANQIPNLDSFLVEPPFSHKNVRISLYQVDECGRDLSYPTYDVATFIGGEVVYNATDSTGGPWVPYKESLTETYEEAVEALRKEYQEFQTAEMQDRAP